MIKNWIVLFHIKAYQLLINHGYNYVNLIHPLSFLIFILCFKLCPVSLVFLSVWKEKDITLELLRSQML